MIINRDIDYYREDVVNGSLQKTSHNEVKQWEIKFKQYNEKLLEMQQSNDKIIIEISAEMQKYDGKSVKKKLLCRLHKKLEYLKEDIEYIVIELNKELINFMNVSTENPFATN